MITRVRRLDDCFYESTVVFPLQLLSLVLQQFAALETQRDKLRAQVTRLCGENNWLRQELQKHQQQLSHAETELARVVEEKQHLEYLLALPKVCLQSPCTFLSYLIGEDYPARISINRG